MIRSIAGVGCGLLGGVLCLFALAATVPPPFGLVVLACMFLAATAVIGWLLAFAPRSGITKD